MVQYIYTADLE